MNTPSLLRTGGLLVLVGVAACGDTTPVTPPLSPSSLQASRSASAASAAFSDEDVSVSPALAQMNAQLAAMGADARISRSPRSSTRRMHS